MFCFVLFLLAFLFSILWVPLQCFHPLQYFPISVCVAQPVLSNCSSCLPVIISHRTWLPAVHQHTYLPIPWLLCGFCGSNHCSCWLHSTCFTLCFNCDLSAYFQPPLPQYSFLFRLWLNYTYFLCCLFLSSFSFTIQPTVFWFHPATSQNLLSQVSNDLIVKFNDTYTASDKSDHPPFLVFLTFCLHNTFSLFSSYFLNADSNLPVNV